ncbi:MAG: 2'-5' RNA ligase family protein [Caldilineaceae bacterium]
MGYAVELHFDAAQATPIVRLTESIFAACGGLNLLEIGGAPHLSLVVMDEPDLTQLQAVLHRFATTLAPFAVTLAAVGSFPTEQGVIYLAPVVTQQLLQVHAHFHAQLAAVGLKSHGYYQPGHWVPHCTVGIDVPAAKVGEALMRCRQADVFHTVTITSLRLIEFRPVREILSLVIGD